MGLLLHMLWSLLLLLIVGTLMLVYTMRHPVRRTYASALARGLPTDPRDMQRQAVEITLTFHDRATTPAWIITGDLPTGPTILMSHGWSSSRYNLLPKASLLAPFASRIVAYDLRAHGDSSARTCYLGTRETHDLLAILHQLPAPAPHESRDLILFGSSLGASISLAAAQRMMVRSDDFKDVPYQLRGLILEGAFARAMKPVGRQVAIRGWPAQPITALAGLMLCALDPDLRDAVYDRAHLAAHLACPILLMHGDEDFICALPEAQRIATAAPQARLVIFPGGRHGGLHYHDETLYRQSLRDFFHELYPQLRSHP